MQVVILKGATKSFALKDEKTGSFGINVASGDDMIEVFQQVNSAFKNWKLVEEISHISKIINEKYDISVDEMKYLISSCPNSFDLLNKAFLLGYSRAMKAGVQNA